MNPSAQAPKRLVARNALLLLGAQVLGAPLSLLINIVAARRLGPGDFGQLYLATTYASFALLFVEWGHGDALTAMIARDRRHSGELLGSSLAWRAAALAPAAAALAAISVALGYDRHFIAILALVLLASAFGSLSNACQAVFRGYERADIGAASYIAWQMLTVLVVVPTLLMGAGLQGLVVAQAACAGVGALALLAGLRVFGVGGLMPRRRSVSRLMSVGSAFLAFGLVLALQTNVDALFLSKLAPAEAIGWQAAARKLVGMLIFPASALIAALYPTLCRLFVEDAEAYADTLREALRHTLMLAAPLALGCALYPQFAMRLFGGAGYLPAAANLRLLSVYVLLVYVTMPLSSALVAAGRQRVWALVQFACVLVSAGLDPLLIPWCQQRYGNGGLGVCLATALSEALMVAGGLALLPGVVRDRALQRRMLAVLGAAALAVLAARLLAAITPWVAAPLMLAVYFGALAVAGEIDRRYWAGLGRLLRRGDSRA